jgi:hypothetical protein
MECLPDTSLGGGNGTAAVVQIPFIDVISHCFSLLEKAGGISA